MRGIFTPWFRNPPTVFWEKYIIFNVSKQPIIGNLKGEN